MGEGKCSLEFQTPGGVSELLISIGERRQNLCSAATSTSKRLKVFALVSVFLNLISNCRLVILLHVKIHTSLSFSNGTPHRFVRCITTGQQFLDKQNFQYMADDPADGIS